MALSFRILYKYNLFFKDITKPVRLSVRKHYSFRYFSCVRYQNSILERPFLVEKELKLLSIPFRKCTTQKSNQAPKQACNNTPRQECNNAPRQECNKTPEDSEKKPGLIQRFKQMYKDYWYVLLPVHMTTSAIWFGGFYYCVRSGVDVISLLESVGISETLLTPLRESGAGYFALALACYKLITPLRYAVTVGGTTYAIKRLTGIGWIKPVPSRERLKEMIQEKKDNIQDRFQESKQHYQIQLQEKKTQVMDEMRRYKTEMRNRKNSAKKM